MKVTLFAPPWGAPALTPEAEEAIKIIADGLWAEASLAFYAKRNAKIASRARAPKGMQRTLNELLVKKFDANGWAADSGYFMKGETWIRVTIRHQMSLGSDFIDAQKVCARSGVKLAIILAADLQTLKTISPNDAAAIVSFEKLQNAVIDLDGVINIPLLYGKLTPSSHASFDIERELHLNRPRDTTIPSESN